MAGINPLGSKRDFDYYDDAGNKWALKLDESNTLLINPSGDVGGATATARLPRNVKPRFVELIDITGIVKRKVTPLRLATYAAVVGTANYTLAATDPNAGTVVAPTLVRGERKRDIVKNFDTGLTDGTNP
jgi:hypothetical protein